MSSLSKYELQDVAVLHLKDGGDRPMYADGADGRPDLSKPVRVWVYGPGSKQFEQAQAERSNRLTEMLQKPGDKTAEAARIGAEYLASLTKEWENAADDPAKSGRELSLEIYGNRRLPHVRDQVAGFAVQTANFTTPSTAS